jgi:hypothetical protein
MNGEGYDSFGKAVTLVGSREKGHRIDVGPKKIMIDYINVGAPFTAFSLSKKRPKDS